jgi:hypothetical protein
LAEGDLAIIDQFNGSPLTRMWRTSKITPKDDPDEGSIFAATFSSVDACAQGGADHPRRLGIGAGDRTDAIAQARTPFIDRLRSTVPNATLLTDGEHVGLPAGQMGNSEVGI